VLAGQAVAADGLAELALAAVAATPKLCPPQAQERP
jgi:hypothetical protein